MTFIGPITWPQFILLVQGLLILFGLALAFAGRYLHDLLIYVGGFITGIWLGSVFLLPIYSGMTFAVSQNSVVSGIIGIGIVAVSGIISSLLAWQLYVKVIHAIGGTVGLLITSTVFDFSPIEALYGILQLLFRLAIAFFGAISGIMFLLFGILVLVVAYANLTGRLDKLEPLAAFWDDSTEDYQNSRVQAVLMIPFGLFFILMQAASWYFSYPRELILSFLMVLFDPQMAVFPYLSIMVGIAVSSWAIWKLHRAFLVVETAVFGAAFISVAGTVDQFITALIRADIKTVVQLIDVFSVTFLVVCILGIVIQSGMVFFEARKLPF